MQKLDERMDSLQQQLHGNQAEQQEQMQKLEEQMQDMRLQLQAEMTELCQGNVKPELQKVQETLTEIVQWRADINAKLTAYNVTLEDHATRHTAVQNEVREMAGRLASLAPQVQDVMTQLEATGDTAKDIRDAIHLKLANHEQRLQELDSMRTELQQLQEHMRNELAEHEQRLKELTTRITLAVQPAQLDEIGSKLRADAGSGTAPGTSAASRRPTGKPRPN